MKIGIRQEQLLLPLLLLYNNEGNKLLQMVH